MYIDVSTDALEIDMTEIVITGKTKQVIITKVQGKFGDKRVQAACRKIISGEYKDPTSLIWCYIREGRIDGGQFRLLMDAVKENITCNINSQ